MTILEAVAMLMAAEEADKIELPNCPGPNGLDFGLEFVVALAHASGRLPDCGTVDDIFDAAHQAATDYAGGRMTQDELDTALARVIMRIEELGREIEALKAERIAESN